MLRPHVHTLVLRPSIQKKKKKKNTRTMAVAMPCASGPDIDQVQGECAPGSHGETSHPAAAGAEGLIQPRGPPPEPGAHCEPETRRPRPEDATLFRFTGAKPLPCLDPVVAPSRAPLQERRLETPGHTLTRSVAEFPRR